MQVRSSISARLKGSVEELQVNDVGLLHGNIDKASEELEAPYVVAVGELTMGTIRIIHCIPHSESGQEHGQDVRPGPKRV